MHIKTTTVGMATQIAGNAVWTIISSAGVWWMNSYLEKNYQMFRVEGYWELLGKTITPLHMFAGIGLALCYIILVASIFSIVDNIFYDATETNELTQTGENWSKIEQKTYRFPNGRTTKVATINRVTGVTVNETTIDRFFGTGTLQLNLTVFLNATEAQIEWEIPGIENPHAVAESIREKSLDHDGARVTLERMER